MRAAYALFAVAFGLTPLLGAATAHAHVDMISPTPRLGGQAGNTQLKTKPCGQTTNKRTTDKVTTYTPGQKVEIKMKEYIDHPGYFAVAFDPDGDDNFPFPIANMDKVVAATDDPKAKFPLSATVLGVRTDKDDGNCSAGANKECTLSITIPNMTCQNCTLQLIQFMYDKLNNNNDDEYYYQCADIKIEGTPAGGSGGGGAGGAAGAGGSATGGASAGTGTGTGGASAGTASGGTTSAGTTSTAGTATTTAGTTSTAGTATTPTAGTTGTTGNSTAEDDGGCGIAKHSSGGASLVAALGLMYALVRRRRAS